MTDQEMRIAIAKACGIDPTTECPDCFGTGYGGSQCDHIPCDTCNKTGKVTSYYVSPDYPNDLNAMHEAEVALEQNMQVANTYWTQLAEACGADDEDLHTSTRYRYIGSAPARQRAEVFLRTIGRWKDE